MKIETEKYKTISVIWTILCVLQIILMLFLASKIALESLHKIGLYSMGLILTSNLILFYINQYYSDRILRILSKLSFILSTISIIAIIYVYATNNGEPGMIINFIFLSLHLIIFWKSDTYYKLLDSKRLNTDISQANTEDVLNK